MKGKLVTAASAVLLLGNSGGGEVSPVQFLLADPGIYRIGSDTNGKPGIQFEELNGSIPLLPFDEIPKAALGDTGSIDNIACHKFPISACALHVSDKISSIRLLIRSGNNWAASPLRIDATSFFRFARSNVRFASDTMLVAINPLTVKGQIVRWSLSDPSRQSSIPLADNQSANLYPVYDSQTIVGFANVQTVAEQVLANDYQPSQWWIFRKDGGVDKIKPISGCRPQAIAHDTIICDGSPSTSSRANDAFSTRRAKIGGYQVVILAPTSLGSAVDDNFFDPRTPLRSLGQDVIFDGFVRGVKRPFRLDWTKMTVRPLIPPSCLKDFAADVHVSAVGTTSDQSGALIWTFGALTPSTYALISDADLRIGRCPSVGRALPGGNAVFNSAGLHVVRSATAARRVPYTLVSGRSEGPAKGKLITFVYGVDGLWLPETYLGDWGPTWLAQGGSIAFVHVRGGGGFGEAWHLSGVGTQGKEGSVADLIDFAEEYRTRARARTGDIGIYAESAGGIVASIAALRRPDLFPAVVLRAGCFSLDRTHRTGCTIRDEFGKVDDPNDADGMSRLSPDKIARDQKNLPNFLFIIPEYDNVVLRQDTLSASSAIPTTKKKVIELSGVNHTDELPEPQEMALKKEVSDFYIMALTSAKGGGTP